MRTGYELFKTIGEDGKPTEILFGIETPCGTTFLVIRDLTTGVDLYAVRDREGEIRYASKAAVPEEYRRFFSMVETTRASFLRAADWSL